MTDDSFQFFLEKIFIDFADLIFDKKKMEKNFSN